MIAVLFTVLSLFTVGTLSQGVAETVSWPFYESGKSLSIFGVAERFEAFISVASTMGYFALYSLLLSALGHMAQHTFGRGKAGIICGAAASGVFMLLPALPPVVVSMGVLTLWILLPGLGSVTIFHKMRKKGKRGVDK